MGGSPIGRFLGTILRAPRGAAVDASRAAARARREGRTAEVREHVQGLIDGIKNRPVPLDRLGLR